MPLKNLLLLSCIILLTQACNRNISSFEKIDFKSDYKFNAAIELQAATDSVPWKYQISASDFATKGNYKDALLHWDKAMHTSDRNYTAQQQDSLKNLYHTVSALEYIIEQAADHQIIIINEAHHSSLHRNFTKSLLKKLYDKGYRNLGLEALGNGIHTDTLLNDRKHPLQHTGFYIQNPEFGNLVREALEIGYHLFPYETTNEGSNGKSREIDQAKNIQQFLEQNPDEKILIHCGFDHALEGNHGSWEKAMAGRLEEFTGINPLTINQVVYSEKSAPEFNHPLLKTFDLKQASVLLDQSNTVFKHQRGDSWTDIAVFHPNTTYQNDRPDWLFSNKNQAVLIELDKIDIDFPLMVLAIRKGEPINKSVPVDITEVDKKTKNAYLALKKGTYEIVVFNQAGDARKASLKVK